MHYYFYILKMRQRIEYEIQGYIGSWSNDNQHKRVLCDHLCMYYLSWLENESDAYNVINKIKRDLMDTINSDDFGWESLGDSCMLDTLEEIEPEINNFIYAYFNY